MLSDEEILERGGTQENIDAYAHDVGGACGKAYGGQCDRCDKSTMSSLVQKMKELGGE